jgi:hypothetical protein
MKTKVFEDVKHLVEGLNFKIILQQQLKDPNSLAHARTLSMTEVTKLWSATPGEGEFFYEGHIYFGRIWAQDKIYILVGTLLG